MGHARFSLLVAVVALGVAGCGGDSEGRTDGSVAAVTSSAPADGSDASDTSDTSASASTAETVAPATTDGASVTTSDPTAPDTTTPAPDDLPVDVEVDEEAVARVQAIVVQADDLPADQGWVQDDDDSFDPERPDGEQPEGCLDRAFDQAGVAADGRSTSVDTGFGRGDVSYVTFGASQSDELPDLEQLADAVVACDGVTDPDGTNLIVVRQPDFEIVDPSVAFVVNVDQDGFLFNALFVLAQRDDITLLSSSTAIVGSAELEIELVLEMLDVMLGRV